MKRLALPFALLISIAAAAFPATAAADTTCALSAGVLQLEYDDAGFGAGQHTLTLSDDGQRIEFRSGGGANVCTSPATITRAAVNSIDFEDASTGGSTVFIAFSNGRFVKDDGSEIDIAVDGGAGNDALVMAGGNGSEVWRFGDLGVNLNADEAVPDSDLTTASVNVTVNARGGNDVVSGAGSSETGVARSDDLLFNGQDGDDVLTGGAGEDTLSADEGDGPHGNDTLVGGGDDDILLSYGGNDSFDPGSGTADLLTFSGADAGVTLDLGRSGPQPTGIGTMTMLNGGLERLQGSSHADVLLGSAGPEQINGNSGDDVVGGRGGTDVLLGWDGNDTMLPRDGVMDTVDCDAGANPGSADRVALELVTPDPDNIVNDCEIFTKIDTSLTGGPTALIASRLARFTFGSNETGVSFECSLDGAAFAGCGSPFATPSVGDGAHAVRVRARDRLGFADPTPAQRSWSVDGTAPSLSALTANRKTFRLGRGNTALSAAKKKRKPKRGTRLSFTSSEAGSARLVVTPLLKGRKVGKRCLKATKTRRKRKSCTRLGRPTTLTRSVRAGANTVPFTGRLGGKALKPGRYRIEVSLADALGNRSAAKRLTVKIVK